MPYIITTTRRELMRGALGHVGSVHITTRRAVATLDEAQDKAMRAVITASVGHGDVNWGGYSHVARTLPEDGGEMRLPDGTVIKVEPISWFRLREAAGLAPGEAYSHGNALETRANVLTAFNAAQV